MNSLTCFTQVKIWENGKFCLNTKIWFVKIPMIRAMPSWCGNLFSVFIGYFWNNILWFSDYYWLLLVGRFLWIFKHLFVIYHITVNMGSFSHIRWKDGNFLFMMIFMIYIIWWYLWFISVNVIIFKIFYHLITEIN